MPKIFVTQPFGDASDSVFKLISSSATKVGASVFRVDSIPNRGGKIVQGIHEAIQDAPLIIADVTENNPNVMYEIGFAQAQNKPLLLIASTRRYVPFDLLGVRVVTYDSSAPAEFVFRLAKEIAAALKSPEDYLYSKVIGQKAKQQNVFISYSHKDRDCLNRLLLHLKPLEKEGLIDLWVDTRLRAGDRWKKEIEGALNRATVAVLLVSADFLASDFITDNELPPLLKNAEEHGTRIIPLIVKPCRFARDKNLKDFQSINDPKDALVLLSVGEQEVYYDRVAAEVERTIQRS